VNFFFFYFKQKNELSCFFSHAHKNTCMALKWNRHNGNWLISASRDHFCKLFDIRNLKEEVQCFRGHKKEACSKLFLLFVYYCLKIKIIIKCIYLILFLFKKIK
jgi:WD40 repeat protein